MNIPPSDRPPVQIDMTPDGQFRTPPAGMAAGMAGGVPTMVKVMGVAILVVVVAGAAMLASLALSVALALLPIVLGAGVVAYGLIRFRMWKSGRSLSRQRGPLG